MPATLAIKDVSKSFAVGTNAVAAVGHVDLCIECGECVMLLGPSGCGKSTLLRVIAGLIDADCGEVAVDGVPIEGPGPERGIVFQDHRLFPWLTVTQNIQIALENEKLSPKDKKQIIDEHLTLVGLSGFADAFPAQLSGGMAQRVAIARALVRRPPILLLDEPFGALDALTRTHMQTELQRIWEHENITMVCVTHDVDEAIFLGDRVVVMGQRPGRIRSEFRVELERPRGRTDPAFNRIKERILSVLERST